MPPEHFTRDLSIEIRGEHGGKSYTATLSTETPVFRRNRDGEYNEVLSHDPKAVNLERSPLPLIERHDSDTMPIGLVENIRIVDRKLKGSIRFGSSDRAKEIEADVEAGIIRNLSIGYSIDEIEERKGNGSIRTLVATRWAPHEVSALAIGADANAGFGRNFKKENKKMENIETIENTTTTVADPILAERKRAKDIAIAVRTAKIESSFSDNLINQGTPIGEARVLIFAEMYKRDQAEEKPRGSINVSASSDIVHSERENIVRDLYQRKGKGIIGIARQIAINKGFAGASKMSNETLLRRTLSTSDFQGILLDVSNKSLRQGYEDEKSSHRAWVKVEEVPNFLTVNRPLLSSAPPLEKVVEGGQYKQGALSDEQAQYKISKYGKLIAISWESLINDSLEAFLKIVPAQGQTAKRKEADLVYSLFGENALAGPTMQDGKALFHSDHSNIATSGTLDHALLAAGRLLLRKQQALGGGYLALEPAHLILPAEHEQTGELLLAASSRIQSSTLEAGVSKWVSSLQLIIEPRLDPGAAFLAASSRSIDHCELGVLSENMDGPFFSEEEDIRTDDKILKVRHVVGAAFLDWRGIVKMPIA